jgi:hypothetical protein
VDQVADGRNLQQAQRSATNGKVYSFDISFVDELTQTYYLADRSNVAVDVVDAKTAALIERGPAVPARAEGRERRERQVAPLRRCPDGGSLCSTA